MNEQEIFLAALKIADPAQRTAFVNDACTGKPELQRQVKSLLASHQRDGEFLEVPVLQQIEAASAGVGPTLGDPSAVHDNAGGGINVSFLQPSTKPGSLGRLGHYEVQEIIGRGGFGIVLKAFDEKLHRIVAIKVMAPEIAVTSPARKRFLREARAAAAIRHENVVSIHAVEDQPIPFLVMEYIDGPTLQQKLDGNGPFEVDEVLRIGHEIASGLEAAHAMGIIHRDIKPCNILLEKGRNRVKITDFGLARASDDASQTQSGAITGTPLYMSPEQAQGDMVDPRSDLFSLGSVLYVMCSGRPPFRAGSALAVLNRVVKDQPRSIREIIPDVPEGLTALIAKLHAKNPNDRFASATEITRQLAHCEKLLQNRDGATTKIDLLPINSNLAIRSHSRAWIAGAVAIVLVAGLGLCEAAGVTNLTGMGKRQVSSDGMKDEKLASKDHAKPLIDWPFAKDDFRGKLVFQDTFDDPKASTVFQGTRRGARFSIDNGVYSFGVANREAENFFANIGSTILDHAFTLRMRTENTIVNVSFRVRNTATHGNWLYVRINPNGQWALFRNNVRHQDGKRTDNPVLLSKAEAPDPELAANKWLTVSFQVSGNSYELWLNGKSVARGTDEPAVYDEPNNIKYAIRFDAWPAINGSARIDLDYAVIWELPLASLEKKP